MGVWALVWQGGGNAGLGTVKGSQPGTVWTSARCSLGETPTAEVGVQAIVWLIAYMQAAVHVFSKERVKDDGKVV